MRRASVGATAAANARRRRSTPARTRALYPFAWRTPVLVVPGLHDSGSGHWQTLLERLFPEMTRVVQEDYAVPDLARWAATVARTVEASSAPPVIVAHSFGCLATVRAVLAHGVALAGALLVAPADPDKFGIAHGLFAAPLPFPSTLVASTNDPWLKFVKAGALAAEWGSRLASAGRAGHVNADSGHGPWPAGLGLLRDLAERVSAASARLASGTGNDPRSANGMPGATEVPAAAPSSPLPAS